MDKELSKEALAELEGLKDEINARAGNMWEECIQLLSLTITILRGINPPDLAYMDAYEKMIEACEEFAVAHYG
jgi:hypothetical protein